ncbi:MAG: NUDIX hydrolase [Halobacteriaceae archaeon]
MDDAVAAARALRAEADGHDATYELSPDRLDAMEAEWVAACVRLRSPGGDRVALVRTRWSGERWVAPGGGVEPGDESLRAAARREVREETGLDATVGDPVLVERQTWVDETDPERRVEGWLVLFDGVAAGESFAADPGEDDAEIREVGWFSDPDVAFGGPSWAVREALAAALRDPS